jgi:outer membrane protein assembly factor BamB
MDKRRRRTAVWQWIGVALAVSALLMYWDNHTHAVHIAWRFTPAQPQPTLYKMYLRPQGGCYAVSNDGLISVLDASGTLLNQHIPQQSELWRRGVLDEQGNLYLPKSDRTVHAYSPDGVELWNRAIPDESAIIPSHPCVNMALALSDGKLYAAIETGECAVLTLDGQIERRFNIGEELDADNTQLTIAPDGGFYLLAALRDPEFHHIINEIIRISPDGAVLWHRQTPEKRIGALYSSINGAIYCISPYTYISDIHKHLYAFDSDNHQLFEYENPDPLPGDGAHSYSVKFDADGMLYVASTARLTALDSSGKQQWSQHFPGECTVPFIVGDQLFVQVTLMTKSNIDAWVSDIKYRRKIKLPIPRGGYPRRFYVLSQASGRIVKYYNLGHDTLPVCGPGPQGEFYGYHVDFHQGRYGWDYTLLRIDLK